MRDFIEDVFAPGALICLIIVSLISVPMAIYLHHQTEQRKAFIAAGYTQTTLPGAEQVVWVKEAK